MIPAPHGEDESVSVYTKIIAKGTMDEGIECFKSISGSKSIQVNQHSTTFYQFQFYHYKILPILSKKMSFGTCPKVLHKELMMCKQTHTFKSWYSKCFLGTLLRGVVK